MKLSLILVSALALGAAVGCSSSKDDAPPGPVAFAPEGEGDGAVVFLRGRPEGNRVTVDVVARGASNIHGVAFRLTWDPEAIGFVEARAGSAWSKNAVLLAKEGTPGQLAVAWSEKGEGATVDAKTDIVLGALVFDVKGRKAATVSFKTERSALVDPKGTPIRVSWRGGSVPAR
jgi:cohesin domain-containing protein